MEYRSDLFKFLMETANNNVTTMHSRVTEEE